MKKKKHSLHDLSRARPSSQEMELILEEINAGSDRTAAILSTNGVEVSLREMLLAHFPRGHEGETRSELFGHAGPLATFFAQMQLAYAMALINERQRHDLNLIRRIRNAFAHASVPLTFSHPLILVEVKKIKSYTTFESQIDKIREMYSTRDEQSDERAIFIASCISMMGFFFADVLDQKDKRIDHLKREIAAMEQAAARQG